MPRTILALHAHPDDESSKGAPTIARLTDEGTRAVLVTATGGEAGDILNPVMDTPGVKENLAEVRREELREAARILGFDHVEMLGYRDSGMPDSPDNARPDAFCNQPIDDVLKRIVEIVRRERPEVVLGYDDHEFYPHPDHLRIHELSLLLVEAAADFERFPDAGVPWKIKKMYAPVFAGTRLRALHDAMLASAGESPLTRMLSRLDANDTPARRTMKYDVSGYIEQGRTALRAHRTQVDPDGFWFAVPTDVVESAYPWEDFELLYSARPWDPDESDLFAGIDV